MPKFFIDSPDTEDSLTITGSDAAHIAKTLRMKKGDLLTVCDSSAIDYRCRITLITSDRVEASIEACERCQGEPELKLKVFMALPKSDKAELVVQKCTELGAYGIYLFQSAYCVPRPDEKAQKNRLTRLRRIAAEAAGQSGRGLIPEVDGVLSFKEMLTAAKETELPVFMFERATFPVKEALNRRDFRSAAVIIGPEGGFSDEEADTVLKAGITPVSLGRRILRCETAAITAASIIMYHANEMRL